ncbi:hypothetical protein [Streptomyces vinaceus]|uniref:hypothetical protein n=1 Tax=Streptomyces vinaceus TaxID=1960 RepID=UPI003817DADB
MLHVPRGWWHAVAATQGRSLHLTCSLTPATGHHLLVWLAGPLLHSPHPARERLDHGRPCRAHGVRRAAGQGGGRGGAPPPHRLGVRASLGARAPGRPAPASRTSATSPADPGSVLALTTARTVL